MKDQTNEHLQLNLEELKNKVSNEMRSRKFKLKPEQFSSRISVKRYNTSSKKAEFRCKMTQIPANSTDATTGHKLLGMSRVDVELSLLIFNLGVQCYILSVEKSMSI
jgi:hypothetical protein